MNLIPLTPARKIAKSTSFQLICAQLKVEPTKRQVSSFRNKKGTLWFAAHNIQDQQTREETIAKITNMVMAKE